MFSRDVLKGKRILVTGGGTGLGKEISLGFAAHGAHVFICGRRPEILEQAAGVPLQRFGTEAEISAAITFLLSPAAAYVTGSCIRVDGGTPNARTTWKLEPHNRSAPFEGFHRSKLPEALKKAPDGRAAPAMQ